MKDREDIVKGFCDEMIEYALQEHRKGPMSEEEQEDRERERFLAEQVDHCLNALSEERKELIDNYISALRSVNYCDYKALIIYGFREGLKFAEMFRS